MRRTWDKLGYFPTNKQVKRARLIVAVLSPVPNRRKGTGTLAAILKDVLGRGLGLAAFTDRVDHDVQQQQHNGHDHDEHGKLALAPVAAGQ